MEHTFIDWVSTCSDHPCVYCIKLSTQLCIHYTQPKSFNLSIFICSKPRQQLNQSPGPDEIIQKVAQVQRKELQSYLVHAFTIEFHEG